MPEPVRLVTAEELQTFPRDDRRYELVEGRVVRMSPVGFEHGRLVMRLGLLLGQHLQRRNVGVVVTEVGFKLRTRPDTVLAPDIAFLRVERLPASNPRAFWSGAPDLAIEVLSPDDRAPEVQEKVDEYLRRGTSLVVVIDPESQSATTYGTARPPLTQRNDDELDLGEVVEGFRCRVREIFD
jgi:Uma2 family endonuclease